MKEKSLRVRLNRLFYIFHSAVYPWLFATLAGLVAAGIALILSGKASPHIYIPVALLTFFSGTAILLCFAPKKLTAADGALEFSEYARYRKNGITFVRRKGFARLVRVSYTVRQVHGVEFGQNPVERLFGVGHIRFCGKATFDAKCDLDGIREKSRFEIRGIGHFDQFREEFEKRMTATFSYEE